MTDAGQAPNQIPETARAVYQVRGADAEKLAEAETALRKMAEGAALLTGAEVDLEFHKGPLPTVPIGSMNKAYLDAMARRGIEGKPAPEPPEVKPKTRPKGLGMTDFGNFAQIKPGIHVYFPVLESEHCSTHTKAFTIAANTPHAYDMMFVAAEAVAEVGFLFMTDPAFRNTLSIEHRENL